MFLATRADFVALATAALAESANEVGAVGDPIIHSSPSHFQFRDIAVIQNPMTSEELHQQKAVEFYAASVDAWYNTSLEHDKSIFALSAGGIGLLIALLTGWGVATAWLLSIYILAIVCFLVALGAVLVIFRYNRTHIEHVLSDVAPLSDPLLATLDFTAISAFGAGAALTAVIGILAAIGSFATTKENVVGNQSKDQQPMPKTSLHESFNKVSNLKSGTSATKSFNNAGTLQPQPTASAPVPATATPSAPPATSPSSAPASGQAPSRGSDK